MTTWKWVIEKHKTLINSFTWFMCLSKREQMNRKNYVEKKSISKLLKNYWKLFFEITKNYFSKFLTITGKFLIEFSFEVASNYFCGP